jgi:hypothetical protein
MCLFVFKTVVIDLHEPPRVDKYLGKAVISTLIYLKWNFRRSPLFCYYSFFTQHSRHPPPTRKLKQRHKTKTTNSALVPFLRTRDKWARDKNMMRRNEPQSESSMMMPFTCLYKLPVIAFAIVSFSLGELGDGLNVFQGIYLVGLHRLFTEEL